MLISFSTLAIEQCEKMLDALPGTEPIIHASFYRVSAAFDQVRKNYAGFYKNSLLFLACTPLESLSTEEKIQRTYDLGIAALLGETVYNFGELVGGLCLLWLCPPVPSHQVFLLLARARHPGGFEGNAP